MILSDDEWFISHNVSLLLTDSIFLFMLVEQIQFNEEYTVLKIRTINSLIKLAHTSKTEWQKTLILVIKGHGIIKVQLKTTFTYS